MIRKVIIPFAVFFLFTSVASASVGTRSNAVEDGIGYRTNLIDPLNPYATSSKRMLWSLLKKYGIVPQDSGIPRYRYSSPELTSSDYASRIRELLTSEYKGLDFPKYLYGYGICDSNNYSSALAFIEAAAQEHGRSDATDRLIVARHHILKFCNLETSELPRFLEEVSTLLEPLRANEHFASWVAYLDGAMFFYKQRFEEARASFSSISAQHSSWLKDTADYMAVRIAKGDVEKSERLPGAIRGYLRSHPKGRYAETVRHLGRIIFRLNDDRMGLIQATHKDFARVVAQNPLESVEQKLSFLYEAVFDTEAIFDIPEKTGAIAKMHPLAVVATLLVEISNDGPKEDTPIQVWRSRFNKGLELSTSYSGLSNYFDLLLLVHEQKFTDIAQTIINREEYGPLYGDALILKARALGRIGHHQDSADLWLDISKEYPLYNALTEAATAYVHRRKFVDFARLGKSWMTDFSAVKTSKDQWWYDEFDVSVKAFYARFQPYRNLLRAGFETMVSTEEAMSVYSDSTLSPIIRFLAAEPIMRTTLLTGNYSEYIRVATRVFDAEFDFNWAKGDGSQDADLIAAYRYIIPKIEALIQNPDDPDALTTVGYFLYSKDRFPKCSKGVTLWESSFGKCDNEKFEGYPRDQLRPIDLLSKALSIYKSQPIRTTAEAKVLRILIFCFKGNEFRCVRGAKDAYPESVRKGYFQRLHKYFPKAAKRTPYWY